MYPSTAAFVSAASGPYKTARGRGSLRLRWETVGHPSASHNPPTHEEREPTARGQVGSLGEGKACGILLWFALQQSNSLNIVTISGMTRWPAPRGFLQEAAGASTGNWRTGTRPRNTKERHPMDPDDPTVRSATEMQ